MGWKGLLLGGPIGWLVGELTESLVDNVFMDKVCSPKIGSVVYCDLVAGCAEHSGIYVGSNSIIHLNGDGEVELVSSKQFISRLGGFNTAVSIYVSCQGTEAVGSDVVARRARSKINSKREYGFILDNCHQFSAGCLTGDFDNSCNFMWMLKREAEKNLGSDTWRVWNTNSFS